MPVPRRRVLQLAAGAIGAGTLGALAGCSSSCPDSDAPAPEERVSIRDSPTNPLPSPPTGSWPTSHGNPGRTGYAPGSLPESIPSVRWRTTLDVPTTDPGSLSTSAPVVGDGLVVVADSRHVHALSATSGEIEWVSEPIGVTLYDTLHEYEANTASPALGPGGNVYVPTADGIVALDGGDGSIRWTVDGMTDVAAPAVVDGTVYALGAGDLRALTRSGEERWTRPVPRGAKPIPPAAGDSSVIAVTERGVRGYDATSGDERWSVDRRARSYPVLGEGTCYVGSDVGLHALDAATGEERWTFSRGDYRALLTPVLTEDTIYVVEQPGEAGAASFALERTGSKPEPRWCSYIGSGAVTAATAGHVLAILSLGEGPDAAQGIVAFTKDFGRVQWAIEGGSRPRNWVTPPAVVDGTVVLTTRGGTVVTVGGPADA